jgi:hypothetical protein
MPDGTKRTIAELITLHELEPELEEVLTEGRVDASLIRWFLRRRGNNATVYGISDRLDIPASEIRKRGQNVGSNKGKVISAALSISDSSELAARTITFVYDIDDDILVGRPLYDNIACLLHTDYRSIELYGFAVNPLDKMLKIIFRADDEIKAEAILTVITEPLISVAFARLVLSRITPPVAMVTSIERRFRVKGDSIIADIRALISDSINSAGGAKALNVSADTLNADYKREESASNIDARYIIRGHDFTRICCYYLKTRYPSLFRDDRAPYRIPETFESALINSIELSDLIAMPLFQKLMQRHGSSSQGSLL